MITVKPPIGPELKSLHSIEHGVHLVADQNGHRYLANIDGRFRTLIGLDGVQTDPGKEIDWRNYTLLPAHYAVEIRNDEGESA